MIQIYTKINKYILLILLPITLISSHCLTVYDNNTEIHTDMISYLYYDNEDHSDNILGYINMNYIQPVNNINYTLLTENKIDLIDLAIHNSSFNLVNFSRIENKIQIYTIYKIEEVDLLGEIDISQIYKIVYNNKYDGLFISSDKKKLTGEIMYFYYKDDTYYDIDRFEIQETFLLEIIDKFPNGAYFNITKTDKCDPYFNYWKDFYEGFLFHFVWIVQVLFSLTILIYSIYVCYIKWNLLLFIFKSCSILYITSLLVRVIYGILFIVAKYYRQGDLVTLFHISDIIGGIIGYAFSLSGLILYISNLHLSLDIRLIDISELSRWVAIIASGIMCILTVIGMIILISAQSEIMYYICYIYFTILLIATIIYYIRLNYLLISILNNKALQHNDKIKKSVRKYFTNILVQNIMLICVVLSIIVTFYVVSPIQTSIPPCLICIFFNITIFMQVRYLNNIEPKKSNSTKGKVEAEV